MNIRFVIQVVVYVLLGVITRAEGPRYEPQRMACDHTCCANFERIQAATANQDDPETFSSRPPAQRQLKHRVRLRGISPYLVSVQAPAGEARSYDHSELAEPLPVGNAQRILPFYYIFLFRFTPF